MKLKARLEENVYHYENAIEDPAALVAAIEATQTNEGVQSVVPPWKDWESSSKDGVNFGKKKDLNLGALNDLDAENKEKASYIINTIREAIQRVADAFVKDRGLDFTPTISPFVGVSKYLPGCYMGAHFDAQAGDQSLKYSMIFYLNDNYEGGEISFILNGVDLRLPENADYRPAADLTDALQEEPHKFNFYLKPNAGEALIFPSTAPYRHQVHTMLEGEKYIVPGFIFVDGHKPEGY